MSRSRVAAAALLISFVLAQGCALQPDGPRVSASGDRDGLSITIDLGQTSGSLVVESVVRNDRAEDVHLDVDQCGRVAEVVLARTVFEPEGETYYGSLGAVKELVLRSQRSFQNPNRFHPRRLASGTDIPECIRPSEPIRLAPGQAIEERWELPFDFAYGLQAVGAANTLVRAEVVESEAPDALQFLDILPTGEAEDAREGRNVRVELETSTVLQRDPTTPVATLSDGQRFDRIIEDVRLREFIVAQPAESWRQANLGQSEPTFVFSALTTVYERAITATVSTEGNHVNDLQLPTQDDLTRVFERRQATLPPGVLRIPEKEDLVLTEDVVPDSLVLPSGRVVADGALAGEVGPLPFTVEPGSYPAHVTLARQPGSGFDNVALASLVLSDAPTVTWKEVSLVGVDGGTAGFTSAEGSEALGRSISADSTTWMDESEAMFDSLAAHDYLVTEAPIDTESNVVLFSTGYGDGGYPVYVGLDADGRPTRVVIDFLLIHLAWPGS